MSRTSKWRGRGRVLRAVCESLERRSLLSTTALLLNEVVPNPYPVRYPNQYVEISGPAGQVIGNVDFVQFDGYGGGTPTGKATFVQNLAGVTIGSNGLVLLKASVGGPAALDSGTTVVKVPAFNVGSTLPGLNGGTNFFALVNYTGGTAIAQGSSYDTTNSGTLTLPTNDTVVDGISFVFDSTPDSTDREYSVLEGSTTLPGADFYLGVTYPNGSQKGQVDPITPDAASRLPGKTGANGGSSNYYYGYLSPGISFYDSNNADNLPTNDGALTPGGSNSDIVVSFETSLVYTTAGAQVSITAIAGNGSIPTGGITVHADEIAGTAQPGTDYTNTNLTFTFPAGGAGTNFVAETGTIQILTTATSGTFFDVVFTGIPTNGGKLLKPNHVEVDIS
jgi:hypothetical protein